MSAAGYLRVQSGTPWAARGRDWPRCLAELPRARGQPPQPDLDQPRSDGELPSSLDFSGSVTLEARLLNVFDNQDAALNRRTAVPGSSDAADPPYFNPYQQPNPFFGMGNAFAPPRRLHLAAAITF